MPSFADMMQIYTAPAEPRVEETPPERGPWDYVSGRYPAFTPPMPPSPLELRWLWSWVLLEELPECADPPGSSVAQYVSRERWHRLEGCLDGWSKLPEDRLAWLFEHEAEIRSLIEQAKTEHFARFPARQQTMR